MTKHKRDEELDEYVDGVRVHKIITIGGKATANDLPFGSLEEAVTHIAKVMLCN